jgi:hypothetical protein
VSDLKRIVGVDAHTTAGLETGATTFLLQDQAVMVLHREIEVLNFPP